jgi:hypothetical protein
LHRNEILGILNRRLSRKPRTRNPEKSYGSTVAHAIRKITRNLDYVCAEWLKPNPVWRAERLQKQGELHPDDDLKEKLTTTSAPTIKQLVKNSERCLKKMAFRKAPFKPNNLLKAQIPIKRILPWDICILGHFAVGTAIIFVAVHIVFTPIPFSYWMQPVVGMKSCQFMIIRLLP